MILDAQGWLWALFGFIVIGFLVIDLGWLNRQSHKVEFKPALYQSIFWITISLVYGGLIWYWVGHNQAAEFLSAYLTEKMLSVDNLFVMMLIFSYFKLEEKYHHRALFWGIMGAVILRAIFISAGAWVVSMFHWVLYVFGAFLVYTAYKILTKKKEEHADFENNAVLKFARKYLPFSPNHHGGRFFTWENGKFVFTSLFLVVLMIEVSDIVFAVDSIPAVFAISQSTFIVYTSNIFAIMGLRALFFLLESVLNKFHHLQKGLAFVLFFIGFKMLSGLIGLHISSMLSFAIIMLAFAASIVASILWPKKI